MIPFTEALVAQLTETLTGTLIGASGRRLRRSFTDPERERALGRCCEAGIVALIQTAGSGNEADLAHLSEVIREFFTAVGGRVGEGSARWSGDPERAGDPIRRLGAGFRDCPRDLAEAQSGSEARVSLARRFRSESMQFRRVENPSSHRRRLLSGRRKPLRLPRDERQRLGVDPEPADSLSLRPHGRTQAGGRRRGFRVARRRFRLRRRGGNPMSLEGIASRAGQPQILLDRRPSQSLWSKVFDVHGKADDGFSTMTVTATVSGLFGHPIAELF